MPTQPESLAQAPQFGLVTKTLRWRRSLFEPLTQWVNTLLVVALILMFKGQTVAEGKLHAAFAIMAALLAAAQAVLLFLAIRSPALEITRDELLTWSRGAREPSRIALRDVSRVERENATELVIGLASGRADALNLRDIPRRHRAAAKAAVRRAIEESAAR